MDDPAQAPLAGELEGNAHIQRQPGIAAADDDRVDERVKLVDETRGDRTLVVAHDRRCAGRLGLRDSRYASRVLNDSASGSATKSSCT